MLFFQVFVIGLHLNYGSGYVWNRLSEDGDLVKPASFSGVRKWGGEVRLNWPPGGALLLITVSVNG